jgi:hypothetical protein
LLLEGYRHGFPPSKLLILWHASGLGKPNLGSKMLNKAVAMGLGYIYNFPLSQVYIRCWPSPAGPAIPTRSRLMPAAS